MYHRFSHSFSQQKANFHTFSQQKAKTLNTFADLASKSKKDKKMANTITNSLSSLNNFFGGVKNNSQKNSTGNALASFNQALAGGNKEALQDAASKLKAGGLVTSSYQASFMEASFTQSGGNFSFQLSVLNTSGFQSAFNSGDSMGMYSKTQSNLTTLTVTGRMGALGQLDDILSKFNLSDIGYEGKPLSELTQGDAAALVSDSGFFGMKNTANRVADFVIKGAGDNLDLLKAGLEGIKRGYDEATKLWGGALPDISQKTQELTLKLIEDRIAQLGGDTSGNTMNLEA